MYIFIEKNRCMNIRRTDILLFYENFIFELVFRCLNCILLHAPSSPSWFLFCLNYWKHFDAVLG